MSQNHQHIIPSPVDSGFNAKVVTQTERITPDIAAEYLKLNSNDNFIYADVDSMSSQTEFVIIN